MILANHCVDFFYIFCSETHIKHSLIDFVKVDRSTLRIYKELLKQCRRTHQNKNKKNSIYIVIYISEESISKTVAVVPLICMHQYNEKMETWGSEEVSQQVDHSDFSPTPTDISECASNPCQNGGTCVEGVNQYKCTCPQNWSGSHCQHQTQTGWYHRLFVSFVFECQSRLRYATLHVYNVFSSRWN